ncbi:Hsp20 family protein [Actinosynnema sp. NPDC047251]|uniref:Hsp20 family protein n=1 Tax=Saccharothrix espanaensis TaxID=103731 RepID=UPI0002DD6C9D|nr:Hsp20 family protein [Saccharothrix espanaensis]
MERLTVRRGVPAQAGPLRDMDLWWERVGRTLGRPWDVSTDDTCPSSVDVVVTAHAYLLTTVIPGACPHDVAVEVHDHDLPADGVPVPRSRVGITVRSGRGYLYCATLPPVDVDRVEAWLLDGVLVVRAPAGEVAVPGA